MASKLYTQEEFEQMESLKRSFEETEEGERFTVSLIKRRLRVGEEKATQLFKDMKEAEEGYPNHKNCVKPVLDKYDKTIKYHDVVKVSTGEILLIDFGINDHHKTKGLVAVNSYNGMHDWLDVYPDGELEVLGNVDFASN